MSGSNRRQFVSGLAAGLAAAPAGATAASAAAGLAPSRGVVRKLWIDPALGNLPSKPWRKIHQDFHNSQHIPRIGDRFDADEFGDRLLEANVDGIVVFAKDMHGYFYYPSEYGPVHPGLDFDLLGAQVKACRERDIKVYAYYCATWDHYLAENRQEWLAVNRDRTTYLAKFDETPGWTALCLSREEFVQLMLDHTREFVSRYELDGAWIDMPAPRDGECFCEECLRQLRNGGLDPLDTRVQREHKQELLQSYVERTYATVKAARPSCEVEFNAAQGGYGLAERIPFMDNLDIEALPTAKWGYYYFPLVTRYMRTLAKTTYGQTGRFQYAWADFGGLKLPAQLHTELAGIVANGAHCAIGDQPPPNARLDPAVYYVIGKAYERIKTLEPYLEGAAPVTEAAIVTGGMPMDSPATPANFGLLKLMLESRIQFDIVEPDAEWERYALLVLPDDMPVEEKTAARLHAFIEQGGRVIASHKSGLLAGTENSWLARYGLHYEGTSPFKPAYLLPEVNLSGDIPAFEYALYEGSSQWRAEPPAIMLARLGEPQFQRGAEHYTSHRQTPFDHATKYAAFARSGAVVLFGFPLGLSYYNHGYWIYRNAFQQAVKDLLPTQLVETDAPLSTEIALTHQAAGRGGATRERYLMHIVNFSQLRHTPQHPDFYEDPIPLTDVTIRLNLPFGDVAVRAVDANLPLEVRRTADGAAEVTVPRVPVSEIVSFEMA